MASVITPSGHTIFTLTDCLQFIGESSPSTEEVSKALAYNIQIDGVELWKTPKIASGSNIIIDVKSILEDILYTDSPNGNGDQHLTDAKKEVVIKYGDACFYKDCEQENTVETGASTSGIFVAPSYFPFYEERGDTFVMTAKPKNRTMCRDAVDFIYACGIASYSVDYHNGQGAKLYSTAGQKIAIVPSGPANVKGISKDIMCYTISIGDETFTVSIKDCCCDQNERIDVLFLDPRGGWQVLDFDCAVITSVSKSFQEVCRGANCYSSYIDAVKRHGRLVINQSAVKKISLKKKVWITADDERFYEAFGAAGGYKVRLPYSSNPLVYPPVIGTSETTTGRSDGGYSEIIFEGYFANNIETFKHN